MRLSLLSVSVVILAGLFLPAQGAHAAINWSAAVWTRANWIDPDDTTPAFTDIRGDATYDGGYYDATTIPYFAFRMRVDNQGNNLSKHVWQVALNTDSDIGVDWMLQLDNSGSSSQVQLRSTSTGSGNDGANAGGTAVIWSNVVSDTPVWTNSTLFTRVIPTGDSSNFDGNADVFIQFAIPWPVFNLHTGLQSNDLFQVAYTTSAQANNINKDQPGVGTWGTTYIKALPEPGSWLLMGMGLAGIWYARRRKKVVRA